MTRAAIGNLSKDIGWGSRLSLGKGEKKRGRETERGRTDQDGEQKGAYSLGVF